MERIDSTAKNLWAACWRRWNLQCGRRRTSLASVDRTDVAFMHHGRLANAKLLHVSIQHMCSLSRTKPSRCNCLPIGASRKVLCCLAWPKPQFWYRSRPVDRQASSRWQRFDDRQQLSPDEATTTPASRAGSPFCRERRARCRSLHATRSWSWPLPCLR